MRTLSYAAAVTGMFVLSAAANATVLQPGSGEQPPDVFAGCPGCTLLGTRGSGGFITASINGFVMTMDLVSAVYSDPSNPFGAGKLDFMYQVTNASSSTIGIARITAQDFTGLKTDVGYTATGATLPSSPFVNGVDPTDLLVDRSTEPAFNLDIVGFGTVRFGPPGFGFAVLPGETSTVLIIKTNATQNGLGQTNVFDGNGVGWFGVSSVGPAALPEPATLALFALGLVGVGLSRRRLAR